MKLITLKKKAANGTKFRGHKMKWQYLSEWKTHNTQSGVCRKCGMEVFLKENPAPNEINISGEAVALNCPSFYSVKSHSFYNGT